jgi:hypothetical protein
VQHSLPAGGDLLDLKVTVRNLKFADRAVRSIDPHAFKDARKPFISLQRKERWFHQSRHE